MHNRQTAREHALMKQPVYQYVKQKIFDAINQGDFMAFIFGPELDCLVNHGQNTPISNALQNYLSEKNYDIKWDKDNKILKVSWE